MTNTDYALAIPDPDGRVSVVVQRTGEVLLVTDPNPDPLVLTYYVGLLNACAEDAVPFSFSL